MQNITSIQKILKEINFGNFMGTFPTVLICTLLKSDLRILMKRVTFPNDLIRLLILRVMMIILIIAFLSTSTGGGNPQEHGFLKLRKLISKIL